MLKFRRIFWKIFIAFWLANLMILGGTMLVVIRSLESHHAKERHQQKLGELAQHITDHYEKNLKFRDRQTLIRYLESQKIKTYMLKLHPITIYDEHGTKVFNNKNRHIPQNHKELNFPIVSTNQKKYQVVSYFGPPPKFVFDALRKFNLLQCFFILFISGFVSFFLSWSFTHPLKRLGDYSRRYASGKDNTSVDSSLLKRGDEIGDLARDIDFMHEKVEHNIRNQKQLLHDVSHELRAPLARLQAVAGILQQHFPSKENTVEKIHTECDNIDNLIQQILNYSRLDHASPTIEPINIRTLVKNEIKNIQLEFPERTFTLQPDEFRENTQGNYDLTARALSNILRNACKYSPQDQPIEVFLKAIGDSIEIHVQDHGAGVKPEELDSLTTPFYRTNNNTKSDGFGLGLSIAKRALDKINGKLLFKNGETEGFIVILRLVAMHRH